MGWLREGRAFVQNTLGSLLLAVRRDTASAGTGIADGELGALSMDSSGNLRVTATSGTGASDLGKAEDDAHVSGDTGIAALAVRRDTAAVGSGTDGDYSTLNVDANGRLHTSANLRNASGTEIGTAGAPVRIDPVGTTTQPVSAAAPSTVVHGQKTITTAGTEEALGSTTALTQGVWVKALHGNTNMVYVGANPVASTTGYVLDAGEEIFIPTDDIANVFIDVDTSGEGVSFIGS